MTTYAKPSVLPAWGETNTTTADMVQPASGAIQTGWILSATAPARQTWNWLLNFCANAIRYFMQRGMVDYDAAETYQLNARVIGNDGNTYVSIQNANSGHTPSTSPTWWTLWGFTLAGLGNAMVNSQTTNGYTTLADGTILQWGLSAALSTGSSTAFVTVTFPIAFPTACTAAVGNPDNVPITGSWSPMTCVSQSTGTPKSTVTFICDSANSAEHISETTHVKWYAIGY
jgi:hypothetical protein